MGANRPSPDHMSTPGSRGKSRFLPGACKMHFVWESCFGHISIDVVDGIAYVNGEAVEAAPYQVDLLDSAPHKEP